MKSLMKVFFVALMSTTMFSQNEPTFFVFGSIDPKMAIEGAHGDGGVLNPEFGGGFNNVAKNIRLWMGYEYLKQINYQKWTFVAFDYVYKINDRWNAKAGIESSIIYRKKINPNDQRFGYNDDNLSFGVNGEIAFKITELIEVFANGSIFRSEPFDNLGNKMKDLRTDVRIGFNIIIFEIP